MNFIQSIRASQLNRHGFIDVLVGITVFQAINIMLIVLFGNLDVGPDEDPSISLWEIAFLMLLVAPLLENLLLIAVAAIHEKLFKRPLLFVVAPLLLTALHFTTPQELPFPTFIRVIELFGFFYYFFKTIRFAQVGNRQMQGIAFNQRSSLCTQCNRDFCLVFI